MAPFPELLKVIRLALMSPAKVKHRKPHQATIFVRLLYLRRVLLSSHWLLLFESAGAFAEAVIRSVELIIQWGGACGYVWSAAFLSASSSTLFPFMSSIQTSNPWLRHWSALKMAYLGSSEITSVVCLAPLALIFQVM